MSQPPKEIREFYSSSSTSRFENNEEDHRRKAIILDTIKKFGPYKRALDIGAGNGWITQDILAKEIHALEINEEAGLMIPSPVILVDQPIGEYDLILAAGVLYPHNKIRDIYQTIKKHCSKIIVTCSLRAFEDSEVFHQIAELRFLKGREMRVETFPYGDYQQQIRVFNVEKKK